MNDLPTTLKEATDEEVAALLSLEEGRHVSVAEVRGIVYRALRKLRTSLRHRDIGSTAALVPDDRRPPVWRVRR